MAHSINKCTMKQICVQTVKYEVTKLYDIITQYKRHTNLSLVEPLAVITLTKRTKQYILAAVHKNAAVYI